jgi:hypothetical protein
VREDQPTLQYQQTQQYNIDLLPTPSEFFSLTEPVTFFISQDKPDTPPVSEAPPVVSDPWDPSSAEPLLGPVNNSTEGRNWQREKHSHQECSSCRILGVSRGGATGTS